MCLSLCCKALQKSLLRLDFEDSSVKSGCSATVSVTAGFLLPSLVSQEMKRQFSGKEPLWRDAEAAMVIRDAAASHEHLTQTASERAGDA